MIKKITFIIPSLSGGGTEIITNELINSFADKGIFIDVIVIYKNNKIKFNKKNIKLINLNKAKIIYSLLNIFIYINKTNTDLIISFFHTTSAILKLFRIFSFKKPYLFFHFTNNVSKQVFTSKSNKNRFKISDKIYNYIILKGRNKKTIFQSVSNGIAKDLRENWGISKKIHVIYNPINISKIHESINFAKHKDKIKFIKGNFLVAVGRLTYQKNFDLLINAFNEIKDSIKEDLIILGDGEEKNKLTMLVNKLNLEKRIFFLGFVDKPYYIMSKASLFILTSRYEGFGNVLVESLACNTNVISSNCDSGPSEILENGKWGSLFKEGDKEELKKSIINNLSKYKNINLIKRAQDFDIMNISHKYLNVIDIK